MSDQRSGRGDIAAALRAVDRSLAEHADATQPLRPLLPALRDADRVLAELPPPLMGEKLAAAVGGRRPRRLPWLLAAPLPLGAAAALAMLLRAGAPSSLPTGDDGAAAMVAAACARQQEDASEVAVAGAQRCVVHDDRFDAVLAPGARLVLGPKPRLEGDILVRPRSAPLAFGLLERSGGEIVATGPLRLAVRPPSDNERAEVVILEGSALVRDLGGVAASAPTRILTVGERLLLDAEAPAVAAPAVVDPAVTNPAVVAPAVAAPAVVGPATPAPTRREPLRPHPAGSLVSSSTAIAPSAASPTDAPVPTTAATRGALSSSSSPSPTTPAATAADAGSAGGPDHDDEQALLARARAARTSARSGDAIRIVDEALSRATSGRARLVLGFERAHILRLRGAVDEACKQLGAIAADAAGTAYEENIEYEREQLGCP